MSDKEYMMDIDGNISENSDGTMVLFQLSMSVQIL